MAWVFQDARRIARLGKDKAKWIVGWHEPDGTKKQKTFGVGRAGKELAFRFKKQIEAELLTGSYDAKRPVSWRKFRKELESDRLVAKSDENIRCTMNAIEHFERICRPGQVRGINRKTLDRYVAKRRTERGRMPGSIVSPATIAKELRYIRAVLVVAVEWKYLPSLPSIPRVKAPEKLPVFVSPEHFAAIYEACGTAALPKAPNIDAAIWWRGLLIFAYMTGWRIKELRGLKVTDLDLKAGTAITRHGDNKGKRDERVKLHPLVVEHLTKMRHFGDAAFPWPHGRKQLWEEFKRIQAAAGIALECHEAHEHTESCKFYGFHDVRRAFATENAESLSAAELQAMMRHKSFTTTLGYINMSRQLKDTTDKLFVPSLPSRAGG